MVSLVLDSPPEVTENSPTLEADDFLHFAVDDELFSRFILCSTLVPRANAFLRERSIYDVVKCETLEKKVSSPEQLGQSNPKFDVPSASKSVYVVKGLR